MPDFCYFTKAKSRKRQRQIQCGLKCSEKEGRNKEKKTGGKETNNVRRTKKGRSVL